MLIASSAIVDLVLLARHAGTRTGDPARGPNRRLVSRLSGSSASSHRQKALKMQTSIEQAWKWRCFDVQYPYHLHSSCIVTLQFSVKSFSLFRWILGKKILHGLDRDSITWFGCRDARQPCIVVIRQLRGRVAAIQGEKKWGLDLQLLGVTNSRLLHRGTGFTCE